MDRRNFLRAAAAAAASSVAAVPALAQGSTSDPPGTMPPARDWNDPSTTIYPDPAFEVFDPRFAKYSGGTAGLVRIWTGGVWTEGPVWFGQRLIFSDIPNDRLMAYTSRLAARMCSASHPTSPTATPATARAA